MNWTKNTRRELQIFGALLGFTLVLIFDVVLPFLLKRPVPLWPWILGLGLLGTAVLGPRLLQVIYWIWMTIAHALNWMITQVLLTLIFWIFFVPIARFRRIWGLDPLDLELNSQRSTYRIKNQHVVDFERLF